MRYCSIRNSCHSSQAPTTILNHPTTSSLLLPISSLNCSQIRKRKLIIIPGPLLALSLLQPPTRPTPQLLLTLFLDFHPILFFPSFLPSFLLSLYILPLSSSLFSPSTTHTHTHTQSLSLPFLPPRSPHPTHTHTVSFSSFSSSSPHLTQHSHNHNHNHNPRKIKKQPNFNYKEEPSSNNNNMLPPHLLSFLLVSLLHLSATAAAAATAYEVLRSHGLPIGLLPKGVRDFEVDGGGRFQARLDAPCTAMFESEVRYNASVAGTISPGQIAGLSGVSAQDLFLWFPVLAIRLDDNSSGIIHFDVGVVDKRLPLSLFEVPPDCTPFSSPPPAERRFGKLQYKLDRDVAQQAAM